MKDLPELTTYAADGRVELDNRSFSPDELAKIDLVTLMDDFEDAMDSNEFADRIRAERLHFLIKKKMVLPPATWTVYATYSGVALGLHDNGPQRRAIFSAHVDEENARVWLDAWTHRLFRRQDYMWHVGKLDNVPIHYLRHPAAVPNKNEW